MTTDITSALQLRNSFAINNRTIDVYALNEDPSNLELLGYRIPIGQVYLRNAISEQYGRHYIPWCIVNSCPGMFLTLDAILYWRIYSYTEKLVAIENNKIFAVRIMRITHDDVISRISRYPTKFLQRPPVYQWLDIQNKSYCGIPVVEKQSYGKFKTKTTYEINECTGEVAKTSMRTYLNGHELGE